MAERLVIPSDDAIRTIVESGEVYTYFHPIIDLPGKSVLGFEASNRGELSAPGEPVRLSDLTFEGCDPDIRIKIDRLCREKALEEFKILHGRQDWLKLFLNVDASILQFEQSDFTYLIKQVEESGLPPESIVIEVGIDTVTTHIPVEVDAFYREQGFNTCVSSVDVSHPFLDCLMRYEPTYMKIGGSFLPGGPDDSYRSKMLAGLMDYARKSGTTVVGTSVDCLNEAVRLLHFGIALQQGSYFSLDSAGDGTGAAKHFFGNIEAAYEEYKAGRQEVRARLRRGFNDCMSLASSVASRISGVTPDQYDAVLAGLINENDEIVMGYILSDAGMQIMPIRFNDRVISEDDPLQEGFPLEGSDHSMEELFLHLDAGTERYVSQSYFSRLADHTCFLVAKTFYSRIGLRHILVLEMQFPS